jgi:uncharacterized protein DUF2878
MRFWVILIAYEAAWFITVIGAGHEHAWPGLLAVAIFVAWRLRMSERRSVELRLMALALALGLLSDGGLADTGILVYGAAWPAGFAPAWILGLWLAFALTILPLFGYLQGRPWLASALGGIGGPLAYLGAARGWQSVRFTPPAWHALLWLAIGWGIAVPLLVGLAGYWSRETSRPMGRDTL